MRLLMKAGFWYLLGCATPIVVAGVCFTLHVGPGPWQAVDRWDRWRVDEVESGQLAIRSWDEGEWEVRISRDQETGVLQEVSFQKFSREGVSPLLEYKTHGVGGGPQARYGGGPLFGDHVIWVDYNADGRFDLRYLFGANRVEAFVSDRWVQVYSEEPSSPPARVETVDGTVMVFDAASGQWKPSP